MSHIDHKPTFILFSNELLIHGVESGMDCGWSCNSDQWVSSAGFLHS